MTFDRPPTLPAGPTTLTVRDEGTAAGQPLSISNGGTGSTNATLPAQPARTYTAIWAPATTGLPAGATPAMPYSWRFRTTPVATDGRLGAGVALPALAGRQTVATTTADVDADDLIDLVMVSNRPAGGSGPLGALHWQRNLGNGEFGAPAQVATFADTVRDVVAGDFNADGRADVAVLRDAGTGGVLERFDGQPGGGWPSVANETFLCPHVGEFVKGDWEVSTTFRVVVMPATGDTLTVLDLTDGSSFDVELAPTKFPRRYKRCEWSTFLVSSGGATDTVVVDNVDLARGIATLTNYGAGLRGVGAQMADLNGDGLLDLVAAETGRIRYKPGLATGGFGTVRTWATLPAGLTPETLELTDLDGDGALDWLVSETVILPTGSMLRRYKTRSNIMIASGEFFAGVSKGLSADVDNDGDIDVLLPDADGITLHRNGSDDFPDLTITGTATVPGGNFRHIVVAGPLGDATLDFSAVPPTTFETFTGKGKSKVRTQNNARRPAVGGVLPPASPSTGAARVETHFRYGFLFLKAGATLYVSNPSGIAADGSTLNPAAREPMGLQLSDSAHYVFDGTTAQVTGAGLPTMVQSLTCANPAGLTLSRQVSVREKAVVSTGRLASNGLLTALSNAQGTAFIADTGGFVTGNVRLQNRVRSLPAAGFRQLTAPVTNTTVADLSVGASTTAAGFRPVVNAAYNTSSTPLAVRPYPSIFGFDESRAPASADFGLGWFSPASLSSALTFGRGYSVLMPANLTYDVIGQLRQTPTVTIGPLTRTGNFTGNSEKSGWHLVGNPFATPLDWDLVTVPAGLSPSISVWVSTGGSTGAYLTRANGLGSLPDGVLPVHQAFFCRVTGTTASLTLDKGGFYCGTTNHFRPAPETRPVLTMQLQSPAASADATAETSVYFADGAALGLDAMHDGTRPGRNVGVPTLAVLVGGEELAIDGRPLTALATGTRADLLLDLPTAGTYELRVGQLLNLTGQNVEMLDQVTGTRYDLTQQSVVRFAAAAGEVRGRFSLHFNPANSPLGTASFVASPSALTLWPNPAHTTTHLSGALPLAPVGVFDGLGREVLRVLTDAAGAATLPLGLLAPGMYSVRVGEAARRLVVE